MKLWTFEFLFSCPNRTSKVIVVRLLDFSSVACLLRQMGGKIQIFTNSCWMSTIIQIFKRSLNQKHVKEKLSLFFFNPSLDDKKIILPVDICFFLREPSPMSGAPDPNEICLCNCLRFGSGLRIGFFSATRKINKFLILYSNILIDGARFIFCQMKNRCSSLYKKDKWQWLKSEKYFIRTTYSWNY